MSVEARAQLVRDMMSDGLITNEQAAEILVGESEKMADPALSEETLIADIKQAMVDAFREAVKGKEFSDRQALLLGGEMMGFFGIGDPVGIRIIGFSELCFPEGRRQFTTIPHEIWEEVRLFADAQLREHGDSMLASHRSHMIDVREGMVPFGLSVEPKEVKLEGAEDGDTVSPVN